VVGVVVDIQPEGESASTSRSIPLADFHLLQRFLETHDLYQELLTSRVWTCGECFTYSVPSRALVLNLVTAHKRLTAEKVPDSWDMIVETCEWMMDQITTPYFDSDEAYEEWLNSPVADPEDFDPFAANVWEHYDVPRRLSSEEVVFRFRRNCPSCESYMTSED